MRLPFLAVALTLATACSRETVEPSAQQNRQLDEAAELLNEAPDRLENVNDDELIAPAESNEARR